MQGDIVLAQINAQTVDFQHHLGIELDLSGERGLPDRELLDFNLDI